jgi:hypothetical protein
MVDDLQDLDETERRAETTKATSWSGPTWASASHLLLVVVVGCQLA